MILINEQSFGVLGAMTETGTPTTLESLLGQCVYRLPQCSDIMILKELQASAKMFCDASGALLVNIEKQLVGATYAYTFTPVTSAAIKIIYGIYLNGVRLLYNDFTVTEGYPPTVTIDTAKFTQAGHTLKVVCSLSPLDGCASYPDWFVRQYGRYIVSGALASMCSMSDRPWSDIVSARRDGMAYHNGIQEAIVRKNNGGKAFTLGSRNPLEWLNVPTLAAKE